MHAPEPQRLDVVFFGDSIAVGQGASTPEGGFLPLLLARLDDSGHQTEHRLIVSAFGGLDGDLAGASYAVHEASGLIVVEVGAHSVIENQALPLTAYRTAYGLMLDCLQQSGAAVVVGTVPSLNWSPSDPLYTRAADISQAMRAEAGARGIAVADLWAATRDRPDLVSDDGMHPGDAGHQAIADVFWQQIKPLLPGLRQGSATTCRYSIDETRQLLG